jgi:tRNA 2-thiouridine synthesizing protein D
MKRNVSKAMKFAVQINSGPGQSPSAHSAYQFIKAALAEGHEIVRVFFYHEGIYHGFAAGAHEDRIAPDWSDLGRRHGVDLILCVSAAERRGMISSTSGDKAANLAEGFRVGGLGQWMEACLKADRVLVFGG